MPPESPSSSSSNGCNNNSSNNGRSTFIGVFVPSSSKLNNNNHHHNLNLNLNSNRLHSNPTQFKSSKPSIPLNFSVSKRDSESEDDEEVILVQRFNHSIDNSPSNSNNSSGTMSKELGSRKSSHINKDEDDSDLDISSLLLIGKPELSSNNNNNNSNNIRGMNPFPSVLFQSNQGGSNKSRFTIRSSSITSAHTINSSTSTKSTHSNHRDSHNNSNNNTRASSSSSVSSSASSSNRIFNDFSSPHISISQLQPQFTIQSPTYSSTTNSNHQDDDDEEEEEEEEKMIINGRIVELETPPTESAETSSASPELELNEVNLIDRKLEKGKGKAVVRKLTLKVKDISTKSVCHQDRGRSDRPKMSCSNYPKCVFVYCDRCLSKKYTKLAIPFEKDSSFLCPACLGICNCSKCIPIRSNSTSQLVPIDQDQEAVPEHDHIEGEEREEIVVEMNMNLDTIIPSPSISTLISRPSPSKLSRIRQQVVDIPSAQDDIGTGTKRRIRRSSLKKQEKELAMMEEEEERKRRAKIDIVPVVSSKGKEVVEFLETSTGIGGVIQSKRRRRSKKFDSMNSGDSMMRGRFGDSEEFEYLESNSMEIILEEREGGGGMGDVDAEGDEEEEEETIILSIPEVPIKRKRGRPFGTHPPRDNSGLPNHNKKSRKLLPNRLERNKPGPKKKSTPAHILDPFDSNFNHSNSNSTSNSALANGIDPENGEEVHQTRGASRRASWGGSGFREGGEGDGEEEEDSDFLQEEEDRKMNIGRNVGPFLKKASGVQKRRMTIGGGEPSAFDASNAATTTSSHWKNTFAIKRRSSSFSATGVINTIIDDDSSNSSSYSDSDSDLEPILGGLGLGLGGIRAKDNWEPITPFKSNILGTEGAGSDLSGGGGTVKIGRVVIWHEGPSRKRRRMGDGGNGNTSNSPAVLLSSQGPPKLPILPTTVEEFNLFKEVSRTSHEEGSPNEDLSDGVDKLSESLPTSPFELPGDNIAIEAGRARSTEGVTTGYTRISVGKEGNPAEGVTIKELSIIQVDGRAEIAFVSTTVPSTSNSTTTTTITTTNRMDSKRSTEALNTSSLAPSRSSLYSSTTTSITPSTPTAPTYNLHLSPTGKLFDDMPSTPISTNPSPRFGITPTRRDIFPPSFALPHAFEETTSTLTSDSLLAPFEESRALVSNSSRNRNALVTSEVTNFDMEMDVDSTSPSLLPFNPAELAKFNDEQSDSAVKFALTEGPVSFNLDSEISVPLVLLSSPPSSNSHSSSTSSTLPEDELNSYINSDSKVISSDLISIPFRFDADLDSTMYYSETSSVQDSVSIPAVGIIVDEEKDVIPTSTTLASSTLNESESNTEEMKMSTMQVEEMILEEIKKIESDSMELTCSWLRDEGGVERWVPNLIEV